MQIPRLISSLPLQGGAQICAQLTSSLACLTKAAHLWPAGLKILWLLMTWTARLLPAPKCPKPRSSAQLFLVLKWPPHQASPTSRPRPVAPATQHPASTAPLPLSKGPLGTQVTWFGTFL